MGTDKKSIFNFRISVPVWANDVMSVFHWLVSFTVYTIANVLLLFLVNKDSTGLSYSGLVFGLSYS